MLKLEPHADTATVIRPVGNLDWTSATALRHLVDDLLRLRVQLRIDLADTDWVDAGGLSALVGTMIRSRMAGVEACVVNPQPSIKRQMAMIGVDQLILGSRTKCEDDAA